MVDDFMVCVDRIITSACFESVRKEEGEELNGAENGEKKRVEEEGSSSNSSSCCNNNNSNISSSNNNNNNSGSGTSCCCCSSNKKKKMKKKGEMMIECRICQEEDFEHLLEAPCACNGTLKFAHRKCIQRWCNKKGDITCEICNQVYSPNYSLAPRPNSDVMAIDVRQSWGPRIDVHDPRYLALAAEQRLLQAEYEDYAAASSGGIAFCRAIALILMVLILVRHALIVTKESGLMQDALALFNVSFFQFAGFLLPCYVMGRALYIIHSRRRRQG